MTLASAERRGCALNHFETPPVRLGWTSFEGKHGNLESIAKLASQSDGVYDPSIEARARSS